MRLNWFEIVLGALWVGTAGAFGFLGWEYYHLPMAERLYSPLHETFGPAGLVGQGLGIIGSAMMTIGVLLYALRKRVRWMAKLGSLARWLQFHIFLCTLGPFLVLLHTTFKFGGVVSIAFWSMATVVASGVFGRYVYHRIPKTIHGAFLTLDALQARKDGMLEELSERFAVPQAALVMATATPAASKGLGSAFMEAAKFDLKRRARTRHIKRILSQHDVPAASHRRVAQLVTDELRMETQIALVRPFQQMFKYWHAFHLPLAILMFLVLGIHIAVAIVFGYTWVF